MTPNMKVAVVGAGPTGLAALKNLREEGFDVTAFEKGSTIGGLWNFNPDPNITSALRTTVTNSSRFASCFSDFPVPDHLTGAFLTAGQICEYLCAYATHFSLHQYIELNTKIEKVARNVEGTKWLLHLVRKGSSTTLVEYDKVVFCHGLYQRPIIPSVKGSGLFMGRVIHSQAFKGPQAFTGLRVLVVGLGNTAADTSTSLIGHAKEIYVSHRRGANIYPRQCLGKPLDLQVRRRDQQLIYLVADHLPSLSAKIFDIYTKNITIRAFGEMNPEWNIHPPPTFNSHFPVVSDNFISSLKDGFIKSCPSLHSITGENEISLLDGTRLTVDAIIFCTGYEVDFSIMPDHDPTRNTPSSKDPSLQNKLLSGPLARLYQNIFDPSHPDSIAWLCYWSVQVPFIPTADLVTMALAQIWKTPSMLPSPDDMNREIDAHHAWVLRLAATDGAMANLQKEGPWLRFLHNAAGTRCNEYLGYGIRGWMFWASEPRFCNLLMTGVDTPHAWRLFEGTGRKRWEGAREAIWKANSDARKYYDDDEKRK